VPELQPAVVSASVLGRVHPHPINERPAGIMAPYLGRQFTVAELDDEDSTSSSDRSFLGLVRAYQVPVLLGRTLEVSFDSSLGEALQRLLSDALPGIPWHVAYDGKPLLRKYRILHTSVAAPPDLGTGQTMSLAVYARLLSVGSLLIDSDQGQKWLHQQCLWRVAQDLGLSGPPSPIPVLEESALVLQVQAAVYANVQYHAAGFPCYL